MPQRSEAERVSILRAHRRCIGPLSGCDDVRIKKVLCIISCYPFKREAASLAADTILDPGTYCVFQSLKREAASLAGHIVYPDHPGVYEFQSLKREAASLASERDGLASINMTEFQSLKREAASLAFEIDPATADIARSFNPSSEGRK